MLRAAVLRNQSLAEFSMQSDEFQALCLGLEDTWSGIAGISGLGDEHAVAKSVSQLPVVVNLILNLAICHTLTIGQ